MSHLIQILLPLADNDGVSFPETLLRQLQAELAARFGGLTAYSRAPAKGVWTHDGQRLADDIIVVDVMADRLDEEWWRAFRRRLEELLRQEKIVVRAQEIKNL
jgi:hypothetical protein